RRKELESELERVQDQLTTARVEMELLGAKRQGYDDASKVLEATIEKAVEKRLELAGSVVPDNADLKSLAARIDALQTSIAAHAPAPNPLTKRRELPVLSAENRKALAVNLAK